MLTQPALLIPTLESLRTDQLDLLTYIDHACDRLETVDAQIEAFLPEADRRERLYRQARELQVQYPDPASRPAFYGVLVGIKDIFHVDGLPTQAGSKFPSGVLTGTEAAIVSQLRNSGALVLGKTVTAEFAFAEPNQTRNPRNLEHTPGGSSSGSAAGVAAGFCSLAFGTQTIGSVIRPAAYCGVVGFKPSLGRISTEGVIAVSSSLDHVGMFTQDVAGMQWAASQLCLAWNDAPISDALPVLGVPVGAYLYQASPEALDAFESHIVLLEGAGYTVRRIPALENIMLIIDHTFPLMFSEMAQVHADYFARYEPFYRPRTADAIRQGQSVSDEIVRNAQVLQGETRQTLEALMADHGVDVWITPAATSAAPHGLGSTGDSAMNLPWTFAGLPTITLPTNRQTTEGLPFGLQCSAAFMADERLLHWSQRLAAALSPEI